MLDKVKVFSTGHMFLGAGYKMKEILFISISVSDKVVPVNIFVKLYMKAYERC